VRRGDLSVLRALVDADTEHTPDGVGAAAHEGPQDAALLLEALRRRRFAAVALLLQRVDGARDFRSCTRADVVQAAAGEACGGASEIRIPPRPHAAETPEGATSGEAAASDVPPSGGRLRAVHAAAHAGDANTLRWLLDAGCDPGARDGAGWTAAHFAAAAGGTAVASGGDAGGSGAAALRCLIDAGCDAWCEDDAGRTPLMLGAHCGRADVVELLVEQRRRADEEERADSMTEGIVTAASGATGPGDQGHGPFNCRGAAGAGSGSGAVAGSGGGGDGGAAGAGQYPAHDEALRATDRAGNGALHYAARAFGWGVGSGAELDERAAAIVRILVDAGAPASAANEAGVLPSCVAEARGLARTAALLKAAAEVEGTCGKE
jgi:ankyrin repeat protein